MLSRIEDLLRNPQERLDVEIKSWLSLDDKDSRALLAKGLIALENHGGGFLLIGFDNQNPPQPAPNPPADLSAFNTDNINNIVKKYAHPAFHCEVHIVSIDGGATRYPVVVVPGQSPVPVRSCAQSPDQKTLLVNKYYVRRPGPSSEEPQTGQEWDELVQRCLHRRRDELLNRLKALMTGLEVQTPAPIDPFVDLRQFESNALARMQTLQAGLAPDSRARFQKGFYSLAVRFVGAVKDVSDAELKELLSRLPTYTGWSPFYVFSKEGLRPYPRNGSIEAWLGEHSQDAGHSDFWRVSRAGMAVLVRGYQEDDLASSAENRLPERWSGLELTLPVWRLAEFLLRVRALGAALCDGDFQMQVAAQWTGLTGRELFSYNGRREIWDQYKASDGSYRTELTVPAAAVPADLDGVVFRALVDLYSKFDFFELRRDLVREELARLQQRR